MKRLHGSDLTIVKLGGSLIAAPELRLWLERIAEAQGPILVVPGGGPFADTVRSAQDAIGFDDLVAHRMAILAMQQYGLLLQALEPRLRLLESEVEMAALVEERAAGVWLPWAVIGRDDGIEPSWEVTSDSLALIMAIRLGAARLLLVKSGEANAADLLDAAFSRLRPAFAGEVRLIHRSDLDAVTLPAARPRPM
jgi:aspartokinase-like uncharacterized kinase